MVVLQLRGRAATGAGARAPWDRSHCPRCRTGQLAPGFHEHVGTAATPDPTTSSPQEGTLHVHQLKSHAYLQRSGCGVNAGHLPITYHYHWCRSTPRSRAGSAELQEDATGPPARPEDLLPTVHEDDEPPPLPDPQVLPDLQVQHGHTLCRHVINADMLVACELAPDRSNMA